MIRLEIIVDDNKKTFTKEVEQWLNDKRTIEIKYTKGERAMTAFVEYKETVKKKTTKK